MALHTEPVETGAKPRTVDLEAMVHAAILAPSPDNNQPWYFEAIPDGRMLVFFDRTRALASDVNYMFDLIALGAAVENLSIAAREFGWKADVEFVFGRQLDNLLASRVLHSPDKEVVASIRFQPGASPDPLYPFLAKRVTSRKPYKPEAVPDFILRELETVQVGNEDVEVQWISDRDGISQIAKMVGITDRIRFECEPFHQELYHQLRFNPTEAEATRDGLDVRCLEVPKPAIWLLKFLRPWKRMRRWNRLGLSRFLSIPSSLLVKKSGSVGLILSKSATRGSHFHVGRTMERLWLKATLLGLAFHPLGSLPIFLAKLQEPQQGPLTEQHKVKIRAIQEEFYRTYPKAKTQRLALAFRLGTATSPDHRSLRRDPSGVCSI